MTVFKKPHTLIFSAFLLFVTTVAAHAADATFSWTPNTETVSGYRIHYGTSARDYRSVIEVGLPTPVNGKMVGTVTGLKEGTTYYFAATAFLGNEKSNYSDEVVYTVPTTSVMPSNHPPTANTISFAVSEDMSLSNHLTATDDDSDNLTYSLVDRAGNGAVNISENGNFTYTPKNDFSGFDFFTFKVNDGTIDSNTATVNVIINAINDAPTAGNSEFSINENTVYSGNLWATDNDNDKLTYALAAQASKGQVAIIKGSSSFTYTPNKDFSGSDSFTFTVTDNNGATDTAMVKINVQHVNKAPVPQNSSFSVDQGAQYNGRLEATDGDNDNLHFSIKAGPSKGTVAIQDNGSYVYTALADASGSDEFIFQVADNTAVSSPGTVKIIINEVQPELAFELGELMVTSSWHNVKFSNKYISPSVIAKATTMNNPAAGAVSIRNISNQGFDIRIRELDNAPDRNRQEMVSFMVMERGHHQIAGQVFANAECTSVSSLKTFQSIHFTNSFTSQPVVLSSIVTENEANAVILRMKEITTQGLSITMQEQEKNDASHVEETVCYIAMEEWSGVIDGLMVEVGSTEKILTDKPSTVSFKQQFPTVPFVLADMQSTNGTDTAIIGMKDLSIISTGMTILEEQSADDEMSHTAEIGGYIAVTPYNPEEDSDQDSLTNEEERTIHTHPGLWDTDQDGINDGNEYDHWITFGMNPEVDSDGDGIANMLDNDSDNDGVPDGVEIFKGYNPTDRQSVPSFTFEIGELSVGNTPVSIQFKNQYVEPVVIADTTNGYIPTQDNIQISNITANGCNFQTANSSPDNSQEILKISYIVTDNYVVPSNEIPAPVDEIEEPAGSTEPPQVTAPTEKPADKPQVTSRQFNFKSLSSLISLFNDMMSNMNFNKSRR